MIRSLQDKDTNSTSVRGINIVVDGIVYASQRFGGINTYFNEVLPRLGRTPGVRIELLVPPHCPGELPIKPVNRLHRNYFPEKTGLSWKLDTMMRAAVPLLNQAIREWRVRWRPNCVFHSSYFTWVEAPVAQVAIVYDLNHEKFPELYDYPWGRWLRTTYREYVARATRVLAISAATKSDVVKYYGCDPDRVDVVHLATDHRRFRPDPDVAPLPECVLAGGNCPSYLLHVGMRHDYKNFSRLLRAFGVSNFRHRGYLVAVGAPLTESEREEIAGLGLEDRVLLAEWPSVDELRVLYSCATAFVYPSYGEGFGVPTLEAMACGTPALLADIPVFREVAEDAALYFDPFDAEDMASSLDVALSADFRKSYSERSVNQALKYSWNACAAGTLAVYRRALGDRPKP